MNERNKYKINYSVIDKKNISERIEYLRKIHNEILQEWKSFDLDKQTKLLSNATKDDEDYGIVYRKGFNELDKKLLIPPQYNIIGYRIYFLRKVYNYSQSMLARMTGIDRTTIIRYEKYGVTPSAKNIELIANNLCGLPDFLLLLENPQAIFLFKNHFIEIDGWLPDVETMQLPSIKNEIHKIFDKHEIEYSYEGIRMILSNKNKKKVLQQIDSILDFTETMLSASVVQKKKGK